jgi:hypothetical protein
MPSLEGWSSDQKVQGGTQGPLSFPRISGIAPNRVAWGPVGRVSTKTKDTEVEHPTTAPQAINPQYIRAFFSLFGRFATRRWLGYWLLFRH